MSVSKFNRASADEIQALNPGKLTRQIEGHPNKAALEINVIEAIILPVPSPVKHTQWRYLEYVWM